MKSNEFDPLMFCIKVGHIKADISVARITGDKTKEFSLLKDEDDLIRSTARQCAEGSVSWNPNCWLSHYPEYTAIFTEYASMFDPALFEEELDKFQFQCMKGTGLSYEVYVHRFSECVDHRLKDFRYKPELGKVYLELAKTLDYASPEEIAAMEDSFEESGCCRFTGIDIDCCPCGRHP